MNRPTRLTAGFVKTIKKPGRYSDGAGAFGLSLLVRRTAAGTISKSWEQRYKVDGRQRSRGLGAVSTMSLRQARALAAENHTHLQAIRKMSGIQRVLAEQGIIVDASAVQRLLAEQGIIVDTPGENTTPLVKDVFDEFVQLKRGVWKGVKTEANEVGRFEHYIRPSLGDRAINTVTRADLVEVLSPLWHEKVEAAKKLKRLLNGLFQYSLSKELVTENPIPAVVAGLGRQTRITKHHTAIPYTEVPAALAYVTGAKTYATKRLALQLLILTATRTSEVRGAVWGEFEPASATWTIPADRMKNGREHRIPLSPTALDVLTAAYELSRGGLPTDLVFPDRTGKTMISQDGLRQLIVRKYPGATTHGFRSSFRDWATEQTDFAAEVAEHALAHLEGSMTIRAYARSDMFEKRRELMAAWGSYVTGHE